MPSVRLTEGYLRRMRVAEGERRDIYDAAMPALMVRAGSRSRTFYFRYRAAAGQYRRVKIGTHPALSLAQARRRAGELEARLEVGDSPIMIGDAPMMNGGGN